MSTVPSVKSVELTNSELIDSLRRFPRHVLPVGVLSELTSRGAAIQSELLRRLESAVDDVETGIGAVPGECFFCAGLLLAHPSSQQLPTLERIVRLDRDVSDRIVGELVYETFPHVLRGIAKSDGSACLLSWLEPLVRDEAIDEFVRTSLLSVLPYLANDETIAREEASDWIVELLREREKCKDDLLSAFAITELSHLGAVELDEFVKECFCRNQVDDSIYNLENWHRDCQATIAGESPFKVRREISDPSFIDIVDRLKYWCCFSEVSDSLHPSDAVFEANEDSSDGLPRHQLRAAEIDEHIQSFRESNFDDFPGEGFKELGRNVEPIRDRLIEEVRAGLRKAGGADARDNNAPFLALVLLISRHVRIPGDLLLEIIDLPVEQFEDLFGDSLDQALVTALSVSIIADTSPIEERLTDFERSDFSRGGLAEFFLHSAFEGYSTREEVIEVLYKAWRSTLDAADGRYSMASSSLLESLCLMSPKQHQEELRKEIESGARGLQFTTAQLGELLQDPSRGVDHLRATWKQNSDPMGLIKRAVMFNDAAIRPETEGRYEDCKLDDLQPGLAMSDEEMSTITVRNTVPSVGRNDTCPCGSGRKYKKCCLRK